VEQWFHDTPVHCRVNWQLRSSIEHIDFDLIADWEIDDQNLAVTTYSFEI